MKKVTINTEKFNNGLSIHQLEDRYEMVVSGNRHKQSDICMSIDCPTHGGMGTQELMGVN